MNLIDIYLVLTIIISFYMSMIWSKSSWIDQLIKLSTAGVGLFGIFLLINNLGYIVKT